MRVEKLDIKPFDKILLIAPHADDESIGAGGLLSLYGSQCDVWLLTDGSSCGGLIGSEKENIVRIRAREFEDAMQLAGASNYRMFGIPDGKLSFHLHALEKERLDYYSKIFLPSPDEEHPDHLSAYEAGCSMIRSATVCNAVVYCYEITRPMKGYNCYLDISDVVQKKESLILCHKSQVENIDYTSAALSLNRHRGVLLHKNGVQYAEVFKKMDLSALQSLEDDGLYGTIRELEKYKNFAVVYSEWLILEATGKGLAQKLHEMNVRKVAIYGYGVLGKSLAQYLKVVGVDVSCVIDKVCQEEILDLGIPWVSPVDDIPEVDAVIVTAIFAFEEIKRMLVSRTGWNKHTPVINLRELVEAYGK